MKTTVTGIYLYLLKLKCVQVSPIDFEKITENVVKIFCVSKNQLLKWLINQYCCTQIDTCNAYYCDGFKPNSPNKPTIWTENWDGWYEQIHPSRDYLLI